MVFFSGMVYLLESWTSMCALEQIGSPDNHRKYG
jgi:hypothetical protein